MMLNGGYGEPPGVRPLVWKSSAGMMPVFSDPAKAPLLSGVPIGGTPTAIDATTSLPLLSRPGSPVAGALSPLSAHQAQALRMFTFTGSALRTAQGHQLQQDFLYTLRQSQDPVELAAVAEMLGRAQNLSALPRLKQLLDSSQPVPVRIAAANALAQIGGSSHADGYTSTGLARTLMNVTRKRIQSLQAEVESSAPETYADQLKQEKDHEALWHEVDALTQGVVRLNVAQFNQKLLQRFQKYFHQSLETQNDLHALGNDKALLEDALHERLKRQYKLPLAEILAKLPPDEWKVLRAETTLDKASDDADSSPPLSLLDVDKQIDLLQRVQSHFERPLLTRLISALGKLDGREFQAALKQALESHDPVIKSQVIHALSERHTLNYASDVYPGLNATNPELRQASLRALLRSPEQSAIQKAMELATPQGFFQSVGGFSPDLLTPYLDYLSQLVDHGDQFVEAVVQRAINPEYSLEARQVALQLLGLICLKPQQSGISVETRQQAQQILEMLALRPSGKTDVEKQAMANMAVALWAQTRDPVGICTAIFMADSKVRKIAPADQEQLLSAVFSALVLDAQQLDSTEQKHLFRNQVVNILKSNHHPGVTGVPDDQLYAPRFSSGLKEDVFPGHHGRSLRHLIPQLLDTPEVLPPVPPLASELLASLTSGLEVLRPVLTRLADSDQSPITPLLAMRILGLIKDKDSVKYLCDRVKDPMKGKIDWEAPTSHTRDPRFEALNLRYNALTALGDIGDERALTVMLNALDDPVLRPVVLAPLGQLAPAINQTGSSAKLARVRRKLVSLMAVPDGSGGMRRLRLDAANALFQFTGGPETLKAYAAQIPNPNFKRHALSALISNDYALTPEHPDHELVREMLVPPLGVSALHARGITGQGVELAIVDGGFVDATYREGFQRRVRLPSQFSGDQESSHPTMVMTTAAGNGHLKGVAPDARVYSDRWPDFGSSDPMDVYKKIIQGKLRGENQVSVINNSWGFLNSTPILNQDERKILKDFKTVVELAEKAGIQMVFAAGNEGEEIGFPGLGTLSLFGLDVDKLTGEQKRQHDFIMDKIITVGAVNTQGSERRSEHRLASFSSRGDSLHRKLSPTLIAPGADMMVYGWDKFPAMRGGSKLSKNPKALVNGTSFASPYVAGVIALMKQVNPALEPADIRAILKKTSVRLPGVPVSDQGHGEITPEAAVQLAEGWKHLPPPPRSFSVDEMSDISDTESDTDSDSDTDGEDVPADGSHDPRDAQMLEPSRLKTLPLPARAGWKRSFGDAFGTQGNSGTGSPISDGKRQNRGMGMFSTASFSGPRGILNNGLNRISPVMPGVKSHTSTGVSVLNRAKSIFGYHC